MTDAAEIKRVWDTVMAIQALVEVMLQRELLKQPNPSAMLDQLDADLTTQISALPLMGVPPAAAEQIRKGIADALEGILANVRDAVEQNE